jgi:pilus assembly protein TadC
MDAAHRAWGDLVIVALASTAIVLFAAGAHPTRRVRSFDQPSTPVVDAQRPRRRRPGKRDGDDLPATIDLLVLAIAQGLLPAAAIREIAPCTNGIIREALEATVVRLDAGERFADAVTTLPAVLGHSADTLADGFAAADRDGLPLAPVLERLAAEARQMRRRQIDERARRLPVRLSVPLVLCTLPSFALLTVVPLLLAALTSLRH